MLVSKRKAKYEIEDKKFLKVGQKFRSRKDRKRGLRDSEEELKKGEVGYKKALILKKRREQERETYVT